MGNENKWEYDYSSQNRPEGGTGYPNVGSSGMNTANQYNDPQPEACAAEPETAGGAGGTTPPVQPVQPQTGAKPPRKKKKGTGRRIARSAVALVMAEGFPRQLIAIFGAANESSYYTDFAIKAFRTYLCMMVLACVNKACFIFLQAVGKALTSTLLSMFREVVFGVGFALLLPVFFGLDGVLYSMPVSDILTFIISAIIIVKTYRELNAEGVQKV